jgi:hypothetical protein
MINRPWFILLWLITCPVFGATFKVTLHVVDAESKPVSNAAVTLFWTAGSRTRSDKGAITDAQGRVVLEPDDRNQKRPVLILSADRKLGAVVGVSKADDGKELAATVGPTARVKGKLTCSELSGALRWANTMVTPDGYNNAFAQQMGESAAFDFILPVGKYSLRSYGTDVEGTNQTVTLTAERTEYDLGTLDLQASALAKLKGKPAPSWNITAARGAQAQSKLSDYKGKWVYLEFWGFW